MAASGKAVSRIWVRLAPLPLSAAHRSQMRFALESAHNSPISITTFRVPNSKVKELLVLTSPLSRVILGPFDILVDIGVPAEKEVIQ